MKKREENLLNCVIKEHIRTGQPVGSDLLAGKHGLKLSSATIRNEMAELEKRGYLTHPYTSAGRIPTEKGYYFYLENFLEEKELDKKIKNNLKKVKKQFKKSPQFLLKEIAKILTESSEGTILVSSQPHDVYFTGLTNLFSQPEFREFGLISHLSRVIDHFDEQIENIFTQIDEEVEVMVGRKNPFNEECSMIITKYHLPEGSKGIIGILGPMRMDYEHNLALLKYIKELLNRPAA
ncbi:MAG: hypothetical protein Athens101410_306 [Parcubacteria group bacterium Athens1014_10]|nr:MAG: hypothetical protein Athens101410_306 [Parcubacteria group bacterium Athens1014_10]TSD05976.1 MAG: hypothetical protein Athens071412_123 [Parcubacteria group bacterium Athens0714_12]